jgi:hypothetical protein
MYILQPRAIFKAVSRLLPTAKAQLQSLASLREIRAYQGASIFLCQLYLSSSPKLSSPCCSYQKDKRAKPGNLPNDV